MIHIPQTTEGHSTHLRIVPRDSLRTNPSHRCEPMKHPSDLVASWSSVAYHVLHDMAECVRVLGLTDVRIEHVLLLLNCYSRYGVEVSVTISTEQQTEEAVVRQLLGELCDVSSEIEDYCVSGGEHP